MYMCARLNQGPCLTMFWLTMIRNMRRSFLKRHGAKTKMYAFVFSFFSSSFFWAFEFVLLRIWDRRSENTKIGSALSGALVSTLVGLAASNLGPISCEALTYSVVMEYLLLMVVPLLLFRAGLHRVVQSTGTLLLAFLPGSGHTYLDCNYFLFIYSLISS